MAKSSTSFKPGWKGGPGRPKGSKNILTRVKEELSANDDARAKKIVDAWLTSCEDGDKGALSLLLDREFGRVPNIIEVKGNVRHEHRIGFATLPKGARIEALNMRGSGALGSLEIPQHGGESVGSEILNVEVESVDD